MTSDALGERLAIVEALAEHHRADTKASLARIEGSVGSIERRMDESRRVNWGWIIAAISPALLTYGAIRYSMLEPINIRVGVCEKQGDNHDVRIHALEISMATSAAERDRTARSKTPFTSEETP